MHTHTHTHIHTQTHTHTQQVGNKSGLIIHFFICVSQLTIMPWTTVLAKEFLWQSFERASEREREREGGRERERERKRERERESER